MFYNNSYRFSLNKLLQKLVLRIKKNDLFVKISISLIQLLHDGTHRTFYIPYKIRSIEETSKNYKIMKINKRVKWSKEKSKFTKTNISNLILYRTQQTEFAKGFFRVELAKTFTEYCILNT